ncbi:MAG: ABC transporter permease [Chloroflexota bacterium]
MRVIDLMLKDLRQVVRDWRAAVFLLGMPIIFTLMFGFAFGGFGGTGQGDPRLPVGFADQDQGQMSAQLETLLAGSAVIRLEYDGASQTELEELVADGDLAAAIIVPAGYSDDLLAGGAPQLVLVTDPGSNAGIATQAEVQSAANRLHSAVFAAGLSGRIYDERVGFSDAGARQAYFDDRLAEGVTAWEDPPISVSSQLAIVRQDEDDSENAFAQSSPGMMAQFSVAGLMGAVTILVMERKSGAMKRLLTTNLSRGQILLGHYLAMVVMIFAQLAILVMFGQLLLKLNYLSQPAATLLVIVAASIFVAALGLLIGALAKSEEQVTVLALIPMFILAGLGGAWVPLEVMPAGFQAFARLTPLAWVMTGFQDIVIRGQGLDAVWLPALVLLAYAVVFFVLGVWRFRIE